MSSSTIPTVLTSNANGTQDAAIASTLIYPENGRIISSRLITSKLPVNGPEAPKGISLTALWVIA